MATKTRWNFRAKEWSHNIYVETSKVQTEKLIQYAELEIQNIATELFGGTFAKGDYATGNMADSLCWGVWYNRKMAKTGYYLEQPQAYLPSYLHQLSKSRRVEVNGRWLAQQFLGQYKPETEKGWEIVFGCLAPYQAYWEAGHYNRMLKQQVQFQAMTQRYDVIKNELSPLCKVDIIITVPN